MPEIAGVLPLVIDQRELDKCRHFMRLVKSMNDREYAETGRRKRACTQTFGCQQNFSDSEKINGMLAEMGYDFVQDPKQADLVILNTCAVREHAEHRAFGNVGALKPIKASRPHMIIGMCGCMMQQKHIVDKIRESYSFVDLVFGTGALHRLPELLYGCLSEHRRRFDIGDDNTFAEGLPVRREGGVRAWLPVSYGCNNFCTYCIVPYTRGRERSRQPQEVLREARELVARGYKDIMLLGQNVNSYGADLDAGYNFARLLREINAIEGRFRIRFMTSHPKDATQELFDTIAACEKVSRHIHLPFQSGSDRVLRLMNRRYTKAQYLELIDSARRTIPGLSLTSDVIVGFPGETYEDFLETVDVVRRVEFDSLYIFIYSKRRGTPAAAMKDEITHEEKTRWFAELLELQKAITRRHMEAYVGRTVPVLCEGPGKMGNGRLSGRTDSGIIVDFPGPPQLGGQFVDVKITGALPLNLVGEIAR